ncbi:hypothetical protein [Umezawaea beigongshangensis]|uniref:hypothetical protein n=1 Tax=Umezawaea beigongshangensis TaxID=2780383 RepID=UPI0018F2099A|nr:hypothetical protein [Umezawaea beigongshangensis]
MIPSALALGALGAVFWIGASRRAVRVTGVVLCWLAATALAAELAGDVVTPVAVSVLAVPLVVWRRALLSRPWAPLYAAGVVLLVLSLPTLLVNPQPVDEPVRVYVGTAPGFVTGSSAYESELTATFDVGVPGSWTGSRAYESPLTETWSFGPYSSSTATALPPVTVPDAVVIATAVALALVAWAWRRRSALVLTTAGLFLVTAVDGGLEPSARAVSSSGPPVVPGLITPSLVLLAGAAVALVAHRRSGSRGRSGLSAEGA